MPDSTFNSPRTYRVFLSTSKQSIKTNDIIRRDPILRIYRKPPSYQINYWLDASYSCRGRSKGLYFRQVIVFEIQQSLHTCPKSRLHFASVKVEDYILLLLPEKNAVKLPQAGYLSYDTSIPLRTCIIPSKTLAEIYCK